MLRRTQNFSQRDTMNSLEDLTSNYYLHGDLIFSKDNFNCNLGIYTLIRVVDVHISYKFCGQSGGLTEF